MMRSAGRHEHNTAQLHDFSMQSVPHAGTCWQRRVIMIQAPPGLFAGALCASQLFVISCKYRTQQ